MCILKTSVLNYGNLNLNLKKQTMVRMKKIKLLYIGLLYYHVHKQLLFMKRPYVAFMKVTLTYLTLDLRKFAVTQNDLTEL